MQNAYDLKKDGWSCISDQNFNPIMKSELHLRLVLHVIGAVIIGTFHGESALGHIFQRMERQTNARFYQFFSR